MENFEEITQKGYVLNISPEKRSFSVFSRRGELIYTEDEDVSAVHRIDKIFFYGKNFLISRRMQGNYCLCRVSNNKIVIPYNYSGDSNLHYLLLDTSEIIDMIPLEIKHFSDILLLLKNIDSGVKPDLIVVDEKVAESDIVLIKNRFQDAKIKVTDDQKVIGSRKQAPKPIGSAEADKLLSEVNLNMMSENPVFLARVHLKRKYFQNVKQLLLDFDLSNVEADYIKTLIDIEVKKYEGSTNTARAPKIIQELLLDFEFYIAIMERNIEKVQLVLEKTKESSQILSYVTLIAKARSVIENESDLDMIDYENMIYEKKEKLESDAKQGEEVSTDPQASDEFSEEKIPDQSDYVEEESKTEENEFSDIESSEDSASDERVQDQDMDDSIEASSEAADTDSSEEASIASSSPEDDIESGISGKFPETSVDEAFSDEAEVSDQAAEFAQDSDSPSDKKIEESTEDSEKIDI